MNEVRASIILSGHKIKPGTENNYEIVEASRFLDLYMICRETQSLPKPGGLLDQDSFYVHLLRHAIVCMEARRKEEQAREEMKKHSAF
jgi:hypothetical protein